MLTSEGYRMFRGVGEIHNAKTGEYVDAQHGDWLYKPEYDCWYVNGRSYPAECVLILHDETDPEEATNLYDEVEFHPNCSVQVLRDSMTGRESVGWWRNDDDGLLR